MRALTAYEEQVIHMIAPWEDGAAKHAAFLRLVCHDGDAYRMVAFMTDAERNRPLTAESMRYVAERWHDTGDGNLT